MKHWKGITLFWVIFVFLSISGFTIVFADETTEQYMSLVQCVEQLMKICDPESMINEPMEEQEWSNYYIMYAANKGYFAGIPSRTPEHLVTRSEVARMVCNLLDIPPVYLKKPLFLDSMKSNNAEYVNAVYAEYLFDKQDDGTFGVDNKINQKEWDEILEKVYLYKSDLDAYRKTIKYVGDLKRQDEVEKLKKNEKQKNQLKNGTSMGILEDVNIVSYIDGNFIPSYHYKDSEMIVVSDLGRYGFDIYWDDINRKVVVQRNTYKDVVGLEPEDIESRKEQFYGQEVLYTERSVYIGNRKIPCWDVNGSTLIYIRDLCLFGDLQWKAEEQAVWLTLNQSSYNDELNIEKTDQKIINHNEEVVDIYISNIWYDQKTKQTKIKEDVFYGIAKEQYAVFNINRYQPLKNEIYLGTVIKNTSLQENLFYQIELNHLLSEDSIKHALNIRKKADVDIDSLVKPSIIIGKMKWDVNGLQKNEQVEILYAEAGKWYKCKSMSTEKIVQLPWSSVRVSPDPLTNPEQMTKEQLEEYMNSKEFSSETRYFVWTDLDRQLTHVFCGSKGNWELFKTMICSSGRNITPTPRGYFKIQARGSSFGDGYLCKNWVQFNGDYLYHSVILDVTGTRILEKGVLGKRASHGCVRFSVENSLWFYNTIPRNTTVWIN